MAGIIFKWRYLKAGASGRHSENLIRYIAQREGVEKLDDSWKHRPVTKAQTELITQILSDYPDAKDSFEYQYYEKSRTAGAASEFITRAIEERVDLIGKRENYVEYIAKRPRVERQGSHGLFTDDGDLAFRLTHPKNEIEKTYLVKIEGSISDAELNRLRTGVELDGKLTNKSRVRLIAADKRFTKLHITIHEGRNRQVRRMFEAVGKHVVFLKRIKIGDMGLGSLERGAVRKLTAEEVFYLTNL